VKRIDNMLKPAPGYEWIGDPQQNNFVVTTHEGLLDLDLGDRFRPGAPAFAFAFPVMNNHEQRGY